LANEKSAGGIHIPNVGRDAIGVGVDGNGNIIGKDINVVIFEAQKNHGLTLLHPKYFEEHKSTEEDFEYWKRGFSFRKLEQIKDNKEFRRTALLQNIKSELEAQHSLLIVGESGYSKTTILMEIICDYFDKGYRILYSFGDTQVNNGSELIVFIEGLLKAHNKVLVAVDNAHDERTAALFYVMDQLNYGLDKNLLFIMTARLPEYEWFVKEKLGSVQKEIYREPISNFNERQKAILRLPVFSKDEITGFILKYKLLDKIPSYVFTDASLDNVSKRLYELSKTIYKTTKGQPILVKFFVLGEGTGEGLRQDVQKRRDEYLTSPNNLKTMLVCALLDISGVPITDDLLDQMELKDYAYDLLQATLQLESNRWTTIHTLWDEELLSLLYKEANQGIVLKRKKDLKNSLESIFKIKDESTIISVIHTVYNLAARIVIPIEIVESVVTIPSNLSENTRCVIYTWIIGHTYFKLGRYGEAITYHSKTIEINNDYTFAWYEKGWSLFNSGEYPGAIECFDNTFKTQPNFVEVEAWILKASALDKLGKYHEAIENYDKALKVDPNHLDALNNKGATLHRMGKYHEAIENYDKVIAIDPNESGVWCNKGLSFVELNKNDEAITSFDKAITIDPNNTSIWFQKGRCFQNLEKYCEAIECYNNVSEDDPLYIFAIGNKGICLEQLEKYPEAIENYDKVIAIDPNDVLAWYNKGLALTKANRNDEAIKSFRKAVAIDPNYRNAWHSQGYVLNKLLEKDPANANLLDSMGFVLFNLGDYEEALKFYDAAISYDSNNADFWERKGLTLEKLGKNAEAKECFEKAEKLRQNT
jgi:tetratricopeptide (TPR) repeat protein